MERTDDQVTSGLEEKEKLELNSRPFRRSYRKPRIMLHDATEVVLGASGVRPDVTAGVRH